MSEDRFYSQVRSIMANHSPEVPASVYTSMRRKLWWSNFTRLSATRFNMWYALLILAAGGFAWAASTHPAAPSESAIEIAPRELNAQEITVSSESQAAISEQSELNPSVEKTSPKNSTSKLNEMPETTLGQQTVVAAQSNEPATAEVSAAQNESTQSSVENTSSGGLPTGTVNSVKPASKKGLKVTTYESAGNKK